MDNDSYFLSDNSSLSSLSSSQSSLEQLTHDYKKRSAILLINVNGCGYPPKVSCSEFEKEFASLNTEFPCYYSKRNESIVVPHYSRQTEIIYLTMAICIPIGLALFSAISLYLLLRYQTAFKLEVYRKYAMRKKALKDGEKVVVEGDEEMEVEGIINDDDEEELTSLSEIDLSPEEEEYRRKNHKKTVMQNGFSKTGTESR